MTRILVAYYSRSGNTQTIARQLARACKADLEPIVDVSPREHMTGYLRSAYEAARHKPGEIQLAKHDPALYDLVVIGTPVWFWNMASPVRAYLLRHRGHLRRVAYFCTYGGAGQDKVLGDMVQLCGRPALDTLAVCAKDIATTRHRDALTRFAQRLKSGAPPSMRPPQAPHPVDEAVISTEDRLWH